MFVLLCFFSLGGRGGVVLVNSFKLIRTVRIRKEIVGGKGLDKELAGIYERVVEYNTGRDS